MQYRMIDDYELKNFKTYITANPNGPTGKVEGAFDSMPPSHRSLGIKDFSRGGRYDYGRLARDEAEGSEETTSEAKPRGDVMRLLKTIARMSPENWAAFQKELLEGGEETDEQNEGAQDEPPPFDGRPRPGGAMGSAARARFAAMHPDAERIAPTGGPSVRKQQQSPVMAMDNRSNSKSFEQMYPDAARIGRDPYPKAAR
jgi:hypothetical protein